MLKWKCVHLTIECIVVRHAVPQDTEIIVRQRYKQNATFLLNSLINGVGLLQWHNCIGFPITVCKNSAISTNRNSFRGTYERGCCSLLA